MMPHPSTFHVVAELRRHDLLVAAQRERLVDLAVATLPRTPIRSALWASVCHAVTGIPAFFSLKAEPLMCGCAALGRYMASRHGLPVGGS